MKNIKVIHNELVHHHSAVNTLREIELYTKRIAADVDSVAAQSLVNNLIQKIESEIDFHSLELNKFKQQLFS